MSFFSGVKNAFAVNFGTNKYDGPVKWTEDMGLFWALSAQDIDGKEFGFEQLKGNVCLVVNVACKCGFTQDSYDNLERISQKYGESGLRVLCFPSNQFLSQEPWSEKEIKEWVFKKWPKLQAQMFTKIDVNGDNTHPVYVWLKKSFPGDIVWNFSTKFLIGVDGKPIGRYEKNQSWSIIETAIQESLKSAIEKQPESDVGQKTEKDQEKTEKTQETTENAGSDQMIPTTTEDGKGST